MRVTLVHAGSSCQVLSMRLSKQQRRFTQVHACPSRRHPMQSCSASHVSCLAVHDLHRAAHAGSGGNDTLGTKQQVADQKLTNSNAALVSWPHPPTRVRGTQS